jgi:type VI secretion system protein ImpJ
MVGHLPHVRGVHPLEAYVGLCQVLGQLAIFRAERRMPASVPAYNHDDLALSFYGLRSLLDLGDQPQRAYVKRPFVGAGLQMQVRIDREWLTADWTYYIGVQSKLKFHEIERLLMQRLDMKVGSSEEVDTIYKFARAGARLVPIPDPPRDFPLNEWTYWRVDRASDAWKAVERTLNLGIRFNERQVQGKVDGEQQIQIQNPETGQVVSLSFALYAMPSPKS